MKILKQVIIYYNLFYHYYLILAINIKFDHWYKYALSKDLNVTLQLNYRSFKKEILLKNT